MKHIDAAVKIDPTYERARAMRVIYISQLIGDPAFSPDQRYEMAQSGLRETLALSINNLPRPDPNNPGVMILSNGAPYDEAYKIIGYLNIGKVPGSGESRPFTSEDSRNFDLLCSLLESQLESGFASYVAPMGFRGVLEIMARSNIPAKQRWEWIERILDLSDKAGDPLEMFEVALAQAISDRDRAHAELVFDHVSKAIQAGNKLDEFVFARIMPSVMALDSIPHLKQLTEWEELNQRALLIARMTWPHVPVNFPEPPTVHEQVLTYTRENAAGNLQICSLAPLARDDKYLYVAFGKREDYGVGNGLARIPLAADGSPVGAEAMVSEDWPGLRTWDTLEALPAPAAGQPANLSVLPFLAHDRLYFQDRLAFDTKQRKWVNIDPRGEIPTGRLRNLHAIDDRTLFGTGDDAHFTLDVTTNEVTLLRKYNVEKGTFREMEAIWRDGKKINGWSRSTLWHDLLGKKATQRVNASLSRTGWKEDSTEYLRWDVIAATNIGEKHFFTSSEGLVEYAPSGKFLRVLTYTMPKTMGLERHHNLHNKMVVPGQIPVYTKEMVRCGKYLAFVEHYPQQGIYLFDPEIDTWYGPVSKLFTTRAVGTERGLWLGDSASLSYVTLKDVVQSAENSRLVWKTAEYIGRREEAIQSMVLLDRAKAYIALREFAKAKEVLQGILKAEPQHVMAIELMGDVHNRFALNEPEEARKYYQQLGQLQDNPARAMVGRYLECVLLSQGEDWPAAQQVLDQAIADFPQRGEQWDRILKPLQEELQKHKVN